LLEILSKIYIYNYEIIISNLVEDIHPNYITMSFEIDLTQLI